MTATLTIAEHPAHTSRPAGARVHRRPVAAASARTYRRRRALVGGFAALVVAVGVVATYDALVGPGGTPAAAATGQPARSTATVVARPGDTLWAIAAEHRGDVAIGRYVDALVALNGGASIEAGQQIVLP